MRDRGIIYFVANRTYSARLLVSLASLRKIHPDTPAAILSPEGPDNPVHAIAADPRLGVRVVPMQLVRTPRMRNSAYVSKTTLHRFTPFACNIFLDADTLVTGPLDELWPRSPDEIVLTQFSNWVTTGRKISGRCRRFEKVAPELVKRAIASPKPAINNGVVGFSRISPVLEPWHNLAVSCCGFICDEIAIQLIHPDYPHRIVDDRYNCSPTFGKGMADVRVMHGHGERTVRDPKMCAPWLAQLRECMADNLGNCRDWLEACLHPAERKVFASG